MTSLLALVMETRERMVAEDVAHRLWVAKTFQKHPEQATCPCTGEVALVCKTCAACACGEQGGCERCQQ